MPKLSEEIERVRAEHDKALKRRKALETILSAISSESAFSIEEKTQIEIQIDNIRETCSQNEHFISENTLYLEKTVNESKEKIMTRERVLNSVFETSDCKGHTDLMSIFQNEHCELCRIVESVNEDVTASD